MIHYVTGDATNPTGYGRKLILHICNNKHQWGAGFVLALSRRWTQPEYIYRRKRKHILGDVQFVPVTEDITVVNMIAQILGDPKGVNIRYPALRNCLRLVREHAVRNNCTIHAPRFGAGLAGGKWEMIEKIVNQELYDVKIFIYDLP